MTTVQTAKKGLDHQISFSFSVKHSVVAGFRVLSDAVTGAGLTLHANQKNVHFKDVVFSQKMLEYDINQFEENCKESITDLKTIGAQTVYYLNGIIYYSYSTELLSSYKNHQYYKITI